LQAAIRKEIVGFGSGTNLGETKKAALGSGLPVHNGTRAANAVIAQARAGGRAAALKGLPTIDHFDTAA
jgi:hypothetical protein